MDLMKGLLAMLMVTLLFGDVSAAEKSKKKSTGKTVEKSVGKSAGKSTEKSIVVYFSHAGENYGVGNVSEGNTAKVAKILAAKTGSELYEIQEVNPYPVDYQKCVDLAKDEQRRGARPAIKGELPDLTEYQTIYLGYPNWWGDCPMIVYAFLEKSKIDGKTILPFCTHEGSGLGSTARNLSKAFPKAKVEQNGLALFGTSAQKDAKATTKAVEKWLKTLGKSK